MPNVGADESSDSVHIPHEMDIHVQIEDMRTDGPLPDLKDPPGVVPDLKEKVNGIRTRRSRCSSFITFRKGYRFTG